MGFRFGFPCQKETHQPEMSAPGMGLNGSAVGIRGSREPEASSAAYRARQRQGMREGDRSIRTGVMKVEMSRCDGATKNALMLASNLMNREMKPTKRNRASKNLGYRAIRLA